MLKEFEILDNINEKNVQNKKIEFEYYKVKKIIREK